MLLFMKRLFALLAMVLALGACADVSNLDTETPEIETREQALTTNFNMSQSAVGNQQILYVGQWTVGNWAIYSSSTQFPPCGSAGCATQTNLYTWWADGGPGPIQYNWVLPMYHPTGSTLERRLCLEMRSFSPSTNPTVDRGCTAALSDMNGVTNFFTASTPNWGAWGSFGKDYYPVVRYEYRYTIVPGRSWGQMINPIGPNPLTQNGTVFLKVTRNQDPEPTSTGLWNFNNTSGSQSALSVKAQYYTGNQTDFSNPTLPNSAVPYSVPVANCTYPNSASYYRYTITGVNYHWNVQAFPAGIPTTALQVKLCMKIRPFGSAPVAQNPTTDTCTSLTNGTPWNVCNNSTCQSQLGSTAFFNGTVFNKVVGTPQFYFSFIIAGQGTGSISPPIQVGYAGVGLNYSRVGTGQCN